MKFSEKAKKKEYGRRPEGLNIKTPARLKGLPPGKAASP